MERDGLDARIAPEKLLVLFGGVNQDFALANRIYKAKEKVRVPYRPD
jgi:hypothetical protein